MMGAEFIIIPTANTEAEPMEMFEWGRCAQAMQNQVFVAMCNRVGLEGDMDFAGQSIVVHPSGDVIVKTDNAQQLVTCEIDLAESRLWRGKGRIYQRAARTCIYEKAYREIRRQNICALCARRRYQHAFRLGDNVRLYNVFHLSYWAKLGVKTTFSAVY